MKFFLSIFLLIFCWILIYIPGLGGPEFRGEEARRALCAKNMLRSGDFLIQRTGGRIYKRKPPMIAWAIAASSKIFGKLNEFSARFPSVFAVLLLAICSFILVGKIYSHKTGFLTALFQLVCISFIDKGRMAEIEMLMIFFTGSCYFTWLYFDKKKRPAFAYIITGIILGIAALCKGPVPLIFFYFFLVSILFSQNRLKELYSLKHLLGLLFAILIFLAWAEPHSDRVQILEMFRITEKKLHSIFGSMN